MRGAMLVLGLAMGGLTVPASAQMQPRELPDSPPAAAPAPQATPAPQSAPAGPVWETIETTNFGQWTYSALRHTRDGTASCAVHTHWRENGRQLRLVALEQPVTINLAMSDPRWTLRDGASARGTIAIDGNAFAANFDGVGPTVMTTRLASGSDAVQRFIQSFRAGNTMRVALPGDAFVAGLRGTTAATDAMVRCIARYFGGERRPAAPAAPGTKG